MNNRALVVLAAAGLLALGLGASSTGTFLKSRIDNAHTDLTKAQAPIPHAALHARALEILQERADTVKAAAAGLNENCVAVIGQSRCQDVPVVAESVPLPMPDPRK